MRALPETSGLVSCLLVGDGFGFTTVVFPINKGGINNHSEHFILWWSGVTTPWDPDASLRAKQDQWVSLLQEAMAYNVSVTITHAKNSAAVASVQVGTPLFF
jgi:hypothetical protein